MKPRKTPPAIRPLFNAVIAIYHTHGRDIYTQPSIAARCAPLAAELRQSPPPTKPNFDRAAGFTATHSALMISTIDDLEYLYIEEKKRASAVSLQSMAVISRFMVSPHLVVTNTG